MDLSLLELLSSPINGGPRVGEVKEAPRRRFYAALLSLAVVVRGNALLVSKPEGDSEHMAEKASSKQARITSDQTVGGTVLYSVAQLYSRGHSSSLTLIFW